MGPHSAKSVVRVGFPFILLTLFVVLQTFIGCQSTPPPPSVPVGTTQWEVYFSPDGGCTDAIVKELTAAKSKVRVQAYSFTSAPIARALIDASHRGVKVEVILDRSQVSEHYSSADFLLHARIPVRIDSAHAIAHNKIMIIDNQEVITGSFNFTRAAEERNAENLLIIHSKELADKYDQNWENHAAHSPLYTEH